MFGHLKFLRDYPYALPTIVIGSIGAIAALVCGLFVQEVRLLCDHRRTCANITQTLKRKAKGDETSPEPLMTTWEVLKSPGVGVVLYLYAHVMLLGLAYTAGGFRLDFICISKQIRLTFIFTQYHLCSGLLV